MASSNERSIFSGARAELSVNGKPIAMATNVSGSESIDYIPVVVLNNIQVQEWVPVGYTVSLSLGRVYSIPQSSGEGVGEGALKDIGLFPKTNADPATHLTNAINIGDLVVQIVDTYNNNQTVFLKMEKAKVAARGWSFAGRDVVLEDVTIVGSRSYDYSDA